MDLDGFLGDLGVPWRRVARDEWGLSFEDVGGWPLHVGIRATGAWLTVQAEVREPGVLDPWWLLHRNRLSGPARYTCTSGRAVWVQADVPWPCERDALDRLLVSVVEAADRARAA